MTETTPTLLAARETLVTGLIRSLVQNVMLPDWMQIPSLGRDMRPLAEYLADDLLASGVVRDVATLADDETLARRLSVDVLGSERWQDVEIVGQILEALAAALGGDQ